MPNSEAIIYLSENRKCFQTDTFRSYETVIYEDSEFQKHSIKKCSDNTLSAQNSQQILADNFVVVVLIPLIGAIEIKTKNETKFINSGEIAYILIKPDEKITVENPYETELVNYLEIWLKSKEFFEEKLFITDFDLEKNRNNLVDISTNEIAEKIFIGKFDGREEEVFSPINNQAFVFAINGVFEVNSRLLDSRTALSLWNVNELEFEGLGRENIILIVS
jgi:quercetin 2,3-dioxygenase